MSKNYQGGDVWSRTTTLNGFAVDELRSVLQKSIRRGLVEEAALAAYELFVNGQETEEVLWRRLEIIATEDVGLGLVAAPAIIEALYAQASRMTDRGDRWIYCAHAVRLLASAQKDNMSMELAGWTKTVVERENGRRGLRIIWLTCIPGAGQRWAGMRRIGGMRVPGCETGLAGMRASGAIICADWLGRAGLGIWISGWCEP